MAKKTLYLIRHALPDYPGGEKMCLGQKNDLPLSACGLGQARMLASLFQALPLEAVYTSPLLRARQTAALIAGDHRPLHVLDDLIELCGGEWDGLSFAELHMRYPEYFGRSAVSSTPPGAETDEHGLARALSALTCIEQQTRRCAALVSHAGINRLLLCGLMGRPLRDKKLIPQDYAAISVLQWESGAWHVKAVSVSSEEARKTSSLLPT